MFQIHKVDKNQTIIPPIFEEHQPTNKISLFLSIAKNKPFSMNIQCGETGTNTPQNYYYPENEINLEKTGIKIFEREKTLKFYEYSQEYYDLLYKKNFIAFAIKDDLSDFSVTMLNLITLKSEQVEKQVFLTNFSFIKKLVNLPSQPTKDNYKNIKIFIVKNSFDENNNEKSNFSEEEIDNINEMLNDSLENLEDNNEKKKNCDDNEVKNNENLLNIINEKSEEINENENNQNSDKKIKEIFEKKNAEILGNTNQAGNINKKINEILENKNFDFFPYENFDKSQNLDESAADEEHKNFDNFHPMNLDFSVENENNLNFSSLDHNIPEITYGGNLHLPNQTTFHNLILPEYSENILNIPTNEIIPEKLNIFLDDNIKPIEISQFPQKTKKKSSKILNSLDKFSEIYEKLEQIKHSSNKTEKKNLFQKILELYNLQILNLDSNFLTYRDKLLRCHLNHGNMDIFTDPISKTLIFPLLDILFIPVREYLGNDIYNTNLIDICRYKDFTPKNYLEGQTSILFLSYLKKDEEFLEKFYSTLKLKKNEKNLVKNSYNFFIENKISLNFGKLDLFSTMVTGSFNYSKEFSGQLVYDSIFSPVGIAVNTLNDTFSSGLVIHNNEISEKNISLNKNYNLILPFSNPAVLTLIKLYLGIQKEVCIHRQNTEILRIKPNETLLSKEIIISPNSEDNNKYKDFRILINSKEDLTGKKNPINIEEKKTQYKIKKQKPPVFIIKKISLRNNFQKNLLNLENNNILVDINNGFYENTENNKNYGHENYNNILVNSNDFKSYCLNKNNSFNTGLVWNRDNIQQGSILIRNKNIKNKFEGLLNKNERFKNKRNLVNIKKKNLENLEFSGNVTNMFIKNK